jgi:bifunctional DNA-binding transcriptional regulator/antitoxin component of YhaV-PrlF toxin-antitoxin module
MTAREKRRRRGMTRLSSKNQVTIPVASLAEARIRPGDELRVEVPGDGRILLIRDRDLINELAGSVPGLAVATEHARGGVPPLPELPLLLGCWGRLRRIASRLGTTSVIPGRGLVRMEEVWWLS